MLLLFVVFWALVFGCLGPAVWEAPAAQLFDTNNYRLLIRQLRNHALQKHLWSSGYDVSLTGRQLDPGQVYHLTKSRTQTLIGAATK